MEQQREFTLATGVGNGVTFLGVASETSTGFRVEMRTEARDVVAMSPGKIQTRYAVYRMLANWRDAKTPIVVIGHGDTCSCVVSCLTERHDGPHVDVLTVELARTPPVAIALVDAAFAWLGMPNIDPSGLAYQATVKLAEHAEDQLSDLRRSCAAMADTSLLDVQPYQGEQQRELHQHLHLRPAVDPSQPGIRTKGSVTLIRCGMRIELSVTASDSIVLRAWKRGHIPLHVDGYDGRFAIASHVSLQTSVDARNDVLELAWVHHMATAVTDIDQDVMDAEARLPLMERHFREHRRRSGQKLADRCEVCRTVIVGKSKTEWTEYTPEIGLMNTFYTCTSGLCSLEAGKRCDASSVYRDQRGHADVPPSARRSPQSVFSSWKEYSSLAEIQDDFDDDSLQYRGMVAAFNHHTNACSPSVPVERWSPEMGSVNSPALPFHAAVRKVMADLISSNVPVPMNGDGFALVRSRVAAQMRIADVRVDVRPVGCTIRVVLDELTAPQYMDWPEAPSVVAPATDVQHAIAVADATWASPGSKRYIESALYALSGVAFAAVVDRGNNSWMEVGSVAVVIDGGRSCDIHEVIYQTGPAGAVWLGQESIPGRDQHIRWFTSAQWMAYAIGNGTAGPGQLKMDTHGRNIRPGTAVFTETCGRCGVSLLFADATRDAEAEAHKAMCFAAGDYVRWTSPADPERWAEGKIQRQLGAAEFGSAGKPSAVYIRIERCSVRAPGCAAVGRICAVRADAVQRADKESSQVDRDLDKLRGEVEREVLSVLMTNDGRNLEPEIDVTNPLDVEYDEVTLRDLLAKDAAILQDAPTNYKRSPLTQTQRAAVSAYHSAQLRERIAKAEAERKAREVSVVVGIDPEDL